MNIHQAPVTQIYKTLSPNGKRIYYTLQLKCPECHTYNTHIYYTLDKKIGHIERCKYHHKYTVPIEQIKQIDDKQNIEDYHAYIINNEVLIKQKTQ